MPYLIVKNAAGFIDFLKSVFGATERFKMMREDDVTVRHAEVDIDGSIIMLAEATAEYVPSPAGMFIYVDNADEAFAKAIELGAKSIMPLQDQDYGRSGGVKDPFGNQWWITQAR